MNDDALVSVVVIFLDAEPFLEEAVRSVFAQTHERWELLLVDDGSTDGGTAIARRYAEEHPDRVRYLEHGGHANRGMSASRNLGIRHAKGDYLAFLDADDVWLPANVEDQLTILEAHPSAAMVYGRARYWHSWTGNSEDARRDYVQEHGIDGNALIQPPSLLTLFLSGRAAVPPPCSVLLRREAIEAVGGFEEAFRGLYEDQVFYAKLCLAHPVFVSNGCRDLYRQHPDSSCEVAEQTGQTRAARLSFLDWLFHHLSDANLRGTEVWRALRLERLLARHPVLEGLVRRMRRWRRRLRGLRRGGRARLARLGASGSGPARAIDFGSLNRLTPISSAWGMERGRPIDRVYIEEFVEANAAAIRGRVLEVAGDDYTRRFGREVTESEVLNVLAGDPRTTIVADLSRGESIPSNHFDCVICTQTLQLIYDVRAALHTLERILKPGGVLLATFPGVSQISRPDMDRWGDYWRFRRASAERLFGEAFGSGEVKVTTHGNVLAAVAFLYGVASEELVPEELAHEDPGCELLIAVRATKVSAAA